MNNDYFKGSVTGLYAVAISILAATIIGGTFYIQGKQFDNTLSVTGSAKMDVMADTAKWSFDIVRKIRFADQKEGYAGIATDVTTTKSFLTQSGLSADAVTVDPASLAVDYDVQQSAGVDPTYRLSAHVTVNATDVDLLTKIAQNASALVDQGVFISNTSLEYYYSKLSDVRVKLSGDAIKDAKNRAESIASASGGHVGQLQSVSGGVIQVLSPNSTDVSDYGTYDTSTIDKEITLSVRAAFTIK